MKTPRLSLILLWLAPLAGLAAQKTAPVQNTGEPLQGLEVGALPLVFREGVDPGKLDRLVTDTWKSSLEMRVKGLTEELAKDPAKIKMPWLGHWINAALYRGDRLKEVNAVIRAWLKAGSPPGAGVAEPALAEDSANPKAQIMAELNEGGLEIKLLLMYGRDGKYPGRLEADIESKLKEGAWETICVYLDPDGKWQKRMAGYIGHKYQVLPLIWGRMWGTENHDVRRKPWVYLATALLRRDPAYTSRQIGGHTVEEWFALLRDFMPLYMKDRVLTGLWIEPGGHYAHITFSTMIDLYETAPDPVVRQQAKMFLDLALIEDEQVSVNGLRGGGRSRTAAMAATTSGFKDVIFGDKPGLLLSDYQAPPIAIVLRHAKGAVQPYRIYNRVPGENAPGREGYAHVSRLVSYAFRTPAYLLGGALQDPNLDYHATSNQRRWSGLIFQSGEAVYPWPKEVFKNADVGRSGNAFWGVQHDDVMVLQKLRKSASVDRIQAVFSPGLMLTERAGWIFAEAGSGYAAVCFVDPENPAAIGQYVMSEAPRIKRQPVGQFALPQKDFLPMIFHAGYARQHGTFEKFQESILAGKRVINQAASELEYRPVDGPVITWNFNQDADPLPLPRVNGKSPDLQPAWLFNSPFLKAKWEDPRIYAGAGPFRAVYDFSTHEIHQRRVP